MATFSTNQVRHIYVAKSVATVTESSDVGAIEVVSNDNTLYFKYMGSGGLLRSDLINIDSISYLKRTEAADLARKLVRTKLILDPTLNSGKPIAGQEYLVRVNFRNYQAPGEAHQMVKHGVVQAYNGMSASDFYKTMVLSLVKNFARGEDGLMKFFLETGGTVADTEGTAVEVTKATKASALTGTYTGIIFDEAPQDWRLGVKAQVPVNYSIHPTTVQDTDKFDRVWGIATQVTSKTTITNGKNMADLEYFLMGERADIYRGVCFPENIVTEYLVDSTKAYDTIDLHYSYQGPAEDIQKSPKDVLIIAEAATATTIFNAIDAIVNPKPVTP